MRGLKAPPRRILAPAFEVARAVTSICSWLSTLQGPAIMESSSPPIFTPLMSITVVSGWLSREASLYGRKTGITCPTLGNARRWAMSSLRSSPITAMTVRSTPYSGTGSKPCCWSCFTMCSACSFGAKRFITMIMGIVVSV